jgi:hypothetical protein
MYISVNIKKQLTLSEMVARRRVTFDPVDILLLLLTASSAAAKPMPKATAKPMPKATAKAMPKATAKATITKKKYKKTGFKIGDKLSVIWDYNNQTQQTHEGTIIAIDIVNNMAMILYNDGEEHPHPLNYLKTHAKMIVSS